VPVHANFRSVLEQYHSSRENAASSHADDPSATPQKHKDSDPTADITAGVAPPVETPRLILPFTTATAPPENADAATQDSTSAADPNPQPSATTSGTITFLTPAIFSSTLDVRSESKSVHNPTAAQAKIQNKGQAKLSQDEAPSRAVPAPPADPSTPLLPLATSSTLQQAPTTVQTGSTASEAPDAASTLTFASTSNVDRRIAYQFHSSPERPAETVALNRAAQPQPKISDPTAATTVPLPVMNTVVAPPPPIHVPADSNALRQSTPPAAQNSSTAPQDPSADSKIPLPPVIDRAVDTTTAAPPQGSLAFAARLTPAEDTQAPAPAPDANRTADSQPRTPTTTQVPVTAKQVIQETDLSSDAHNSGSGSQSPDQEKMSDRFAKLETLLPQTRAAAVDQPAAAVTTHASTPPLSAAARMDEVQEAPVPPTSGNHDITIRIPDATTDQSTAVRFVERAGEVHVSVRTGDAEMAQTLRGGLNDLVNRLEDGGIRTQVWQPGADASTSQNNSQNNSQQPFADPDGSNGRQYSSGSNAEQESRQQNKPRWVEELEGSIRNPNFKETTQLLWQA
jgi:hypothetical protein